MFYFFLKRLQGNDINLIVLPQRCFSSPFTIKALTCCRDAAGHDFCLQLLLWLTYGLACVSVSLDPANVVSKGDWQ